MKKNFKFITLILILLCSIFFIGCGKKVKNTTWKATDVSLNSNAKDSDRKMYDVFKNNIAMMNWTFSFDENNTFTTNIQSEKAVSGTYTQSGSKVTFTINEDSETVTILGDKFALTNEGIDYIFTLQEK